MGMTGRSGLYLAAGAVEMAKMLTIQSFEIGGLGGARDAVDEVDKGSKGLNLAVQAKGEKPKRLPKLFCFDLVLVGTVPVVAFGEEVGR